VNEDLETHPPGAHERMETVLETNPTPRLRLLKTTRLKLKISHRGSNGS